MKRVHFIGSGYESVKSVLIKADTYKEAFDKAERMYKDCGWDFHYCGLECDEYEH